MGEIGTLKIALVKQTVYNDLYTIQEGTPEEIISSSLRRPGPIGLLYANADFHIVETVKGELTSRWKEKVTDCSQRSVDYYLNKVAGEHVDFKKVRALDWSQYDIVICFDFPFSEKIIEQTIDTTFASVIGEPCIRSFREMAGKGNLGGYDLLLNQEVPGFLFTYRMKYFLKWQGYLPIPNFLLSLNKHQIDFPYSFGQFGQLCSQESSIRSGYMMEFYSTTNKLKLPGIHEVVGDKSVKVRIKQLSKVKYFIVYRNDNFRKLRGNSVVEASLCGAVVLVEKDSLYPNYMRLYGRRSAYSNLKHLLTLLHELESNECSYNDLKNYQKRRVNLYCYEKPLKKLVKSVKS